MKDLVARRIKAAREQAGLTQQELSDRLGFNDRQILSAIESGKRKVSAEELLKAIQILERDIDYFTDPFRLEGEGSFSWRTTTEQVDSIDEFESWARGCIAVYRNLASHATWLTSPMTLGLTNKSSYEDAHRTAEWLAMEWELGDIPATTLEKAISERLRALVLYIDPPEGISGAAFRLTELSAVLINRNETTGRRNFDLAHELFHLLTWDTIKPDHSDYSDGPNAGKRSEQLANCFASALLMPERTMKSYWSGHPLDDDANIRSWISESAQRFQVSVKALMWRLVQLKLIDREFIEDTEQWSVVSGADEEKPKPLSLDYMRILERGIEEGGISVRRAAGLLNMTIDDLADLFRGYSLEVPFDI